MKKIYIIMLFFVISGCMNTVTRFWNSSGSSFSWSEKKSLAWHECSQKLNKEKSYSSEVDVYAFMKTCMSNKGFK